MKAYYLIAVFVVTTIAGYKVIKDVPSLLHTPLMSGMNALSGITILGALVSTAAAVRTGSKILGVVAIIFAMVNVAGGFCVTHRMLKMFKNQPEEE
jgi:NAD(P) transhydrogenase subunit alpha